MYESVWLFAHTRQWACIESKVGICRPVSSPPCLQCGGRVEITLGEHTVALRGTLWHSRVTVSSSQHSSSQNTQIPSAMMLRTKYKLLQNNFFGSIPMEKTPYRFELLQTTITTTNLWWDAYYTVKTWKILRWWDHLYHGSRHVLDPADLIICSENPL